MNFSDYWQENKRFVTSVCTGVVLFFVAFLLLDGSLGSKDLTIRKRISEAQSKLREPLYSGQDREDAESDHAALQTALDQLSKEAVFEPRPDFVLKPGEGAASNLYFQRVDEVRESLRRLASRARANLPEGLDLEPLMTNDADTIERHLLALDLIDRIVRHALASGMQSVDRIQVELDPGFKSKEGVGIVERTQVLLDLRGSSRAVSAMIVASQGNEFGKPLIVDDLDIKIDRRDPDLVLVSMRLSAIQLHEPQRTEDLE
ncbi:MAG: hypothetical protein H6830_11330 [Planctomycetes bacterium]|nr:hypothetical protein [Planctomycetota bacterium]MCB9908741.1 hypothetical protein [Planctomycetota bacterium]MCB9912434.1 hypothetical protein [Planctomycetota bacterium]HPF15113.1 hypothetical protein [Planctomycetota bacterium]HRV81209.1 hypothetical protein [Planctomycetota bacterium]